jgi:uncharacterized protein YceH (UPF0502 family)
MAAARSRKIRRTKAHEKDLVGRLADAGEEALQRLTDLPGGQRALTAFNELRSRVDELAKRVSGAEDLEARITALEKEVAALKKAKPPSRSASASRSRTTRSSPE